jgi:formylglycine-generating enzyme required for sulfatase activity
VDSDGDGFPDDWETAHGYDPNNSNDPDPDGDDDNDGLTNQEEYDNGTDPKNPDTDGDGYSDGEEVAKGTNPLDPNDYPSNLSSAADITALRVNEFIGVFGSGNTITVTQSAGSDIDNVYPTVTVSPGADYSPKGGQSFTAGPVKYTVTAADGVTTKDYWVTVTAEAPPAGQQTTNTVNGVSFNVRYMPAGSFQRDATLSNVTMITKGYWIGETEVTQELWQAVMGSNPSTFHTNPENGESDGWKKLPLETISWYDALVFCNKMSIATGKTPVYSVKVGGQEINWANPTIPANSDANWNGAKMVAGADGYRLPTDAEWIWAAMGADTAAPGAKNTTGWNKAFAGSTGNNNINNYSWSVDNPILGMGNTTHEVGKLLPNELGLYDMSGNVWEWTWDWYSLYDSGTLTDPRGADWGTYRVLRGQSWNNPPGDNVFIYRGTKVPESRTYGYSVGLRIVCP